MDILSFYRQNRQMESLIEMHTLLEEFPGILAKQKLDEALARERKARNDLREIAKIGRISKSTNNKRMFKRQNRKIKLVIRSITSEYFHELEETIKKNKGADKNLKSEAKWRSAFERAIDWEHFNLRDWRRKPLNQQKINFVLQRLKFVAELGDDPNRILLRDDRRIREKYQIKMDGGGVEKLVLRGNPNLEFVAREKWFDTLKEFIYGHRLVKKMPIYHSIQKKFANITSKVVRTFLHLMKTELLSKN